MRAILVLIRLIREKQKKKKNDVSSIARIFGIDEDVSFNFNSLWLKCKGEIKLKDVLKSLRECYEWISFGSSWDAKYNKIIIYNKISAKYCESKYLSLNIRGAVSIENKLFNFY